MSVIDLSKLELEEVRDGDGNLDFAFDFPVYAAKGSADSAVVYMEIAPGRGLGMHKDSAEEIVLVLEGDAEGTIAGKSSKLSKGQLVVIPAMVPHDLRNVGEEPLRAVGFFSSASVVHFFEPSPIPGTSVLVEVHDSAGARTLVGEEFDPE